MRRYQLIPSHAVQTLLITTTSPLPSGEVGFPYSFTFNAIGGVAPFSWAVTAGTLPAGLMLASSGTLSGTPTSTFASSFSVTVTDSVNSQFTKVFGMTVVTAVTITTASPLANATQGLAYSFTMSATGGATPYTWSLLGQVGTNTWSVSSAGVVTGTPSVLETDILNIQVVDALGVPSAKNFNLQVVTAGGGLTITNASPLPNATQEQSYQGTVTLAASGGSGTGYVFSLISQTGSNAWSVIQLSPGVSPYIIVGTPRFATTDSLVIQCTDSANNTVQKTFSLTVTAVALAISTTSPLPNATIGQPYSFLMSPVGGVTPYTWAITADTPNTGGWLSINSASGNLQGTPGTLETESLTIQLTDFVGTVVSKSFTLQVQTPAAIVPDFWISPNGDDSNNGLTPATAWSITAFNTKQATYGGKTVGVIGDTGTTLTGVAITGTSGQFSCTGTAPALGTRVLISGNFGGTGSISGYANPTMYVVSASGAGTFSLATEAGFCRNPVVNVATTAGTPSGLTFIVNTPIQFGRVSGVQTSLYSKYQALVAPQDQTVIHLNGGTSARSTYIASFTSAGVYQARWAIIDASQPGSAFGAVVPTNTSNGACLMGQGQNNEVTNYGFITVDGLVIRYFNYSGLLFFGPGGGKSSDIGGLVVKNSEIYGGNHVDSGNNPGGLYFQGFLGAVINNNKIHDCVTTSGLFPDGMAAIMSLTGSASGTGCIVTNNTTFNCAAGITFKDEWQWGTVAYNYFDMGIFGSYGFNGNTGEGVNRCCPGVGQTLTIHHNISVGPIYGGHPGSTVHWVNGTVNCYNNTAYVTTNTPNGQRNFVSLNTNSATLGLMNFYNNLCYQLVGTTADTTVFIVNTQGITATSMDHNAYIPSRCFFGSFGSGAPIDTTLATWQSTYGFDTHSLSLPTTSPFLGTPVYGGDVLSFAISPANPLYTSGVTAPGGATGQIIGACDQFGNASDGSGIIGCNF